MEEFPDEFIEPTPMRRLRSVVGSPHYIAPEVSSDGTIDFEDYERFHNLIRNYL